jgi:hypothetical protein
MIHHPNYSSNEEPGLMHGVLQRDSMKPLDRHEVVCALRVIGLLG